MSKQLSIASAFSIFALAALALLGPKAAEPSAPTQTGATFAFAAPAFTVGLPLID